MLHIYRQIASLRNTRTFVMTKALQNAERFPFSDIEIIPQPHTNLLRHGWLKLVKRRPPIVYRGEYQMLSSLLERRGADLMHVYFGHTGVHLLPFIECWDKPCVVSFHGADVAEKADIPNYATRLRRMFQAVPLVFARSQSLADRLIHLGCPPDRLRINRTGVPLRDFPFVRRNAPENGHWRFFQASRLIPKKGVPTALRAFAVVQRQYRNAEFLIAGKGPLQSELERLITQLGIDGQVRFCGFLAQAELVKMYSMAHIFLHPSETPPNHDQEGVPNSILEAMATGLPVVATRHGGIPEAIEDGRTGLLVREGDYRALATTMMRLIRAPLLREEIGWRASESVATNFEQAEQVRRLESFYDEAMALREIAAETEPRAVVPEPSRLVAHASVD